ncbi:alpha/beta fold hydrolase [Streptomyces fulvorobeus]|uniref:Alpha/beta hydrolase n=1 Tax=Streptomyces fulvorobeus TaxID=284028 RepID=A0A7J0C7E0_9ACTN|nr:alpha/beta fold hydrolase [Streptomyces fulvorobeus]NYE41310.1 pimeloyl-ACP methyl ester carboxylesterase [Streptomyces fulvorobeus]GFM97656.1 alpha/beta hydrolase [Streptomyces fulvorobeus]
MEFMTRHGFVTAYDDLGPSSGPPVVLVHGHPFDRSMWRPQTEVLVRAGFRVVVPDLRGYGASGVVPGRTLLADFADDIAELLDHLGVQRAVVGGLSMGGQIAMEFHRGYGERVAGLVLADTSPVAETEEGRAVRIGMADRLLAEGMGGYADEVIGRMLAPYNVTELPDVAAHVLGMMRGTAPEGAAAALRGRAERPDYRESLAAARVPVLIVVGADDSYTPAADARVTHGLIPGSGLAVVERAGHMPNLEQPERFNAALLGFLACL